MVDTEKVENWKEQLGIERQSREGYEKTSLCTPITRSD